MNEETAMSLPGQPRVTVNRKEVRGGSDDGCRYVELVLHCGEISMGVGMNAGACRYLAGQLLAVASWADPPAVPVVPPPPPTAEPGP